MASGQVRPPWYNPWVAGGAGDQMSAANGQHSGLVAWQAPNVQDADLANIVRNPIMQMGAQAVWVFGQCFGGGMFDELNALGGTQSGISASTFNQLANYPNPGPNPPGGNGLDFVWAYINGMKVTPRAESIAAVGAGDDPFGPNNDPITPRGNEPIGAEQPWYFSTGAGADNLQVARQPRGIAVLWSGDPGIVDRDQIIKVVNTLTTTFGYQPKQIFVLYKSGMLPTGMGGDPLGNQLKNLNIVLRAATKKQLTNLFNQAFGANQMVKPNFIFFLANDHGFNTAMAPAGAPKQGNNGGSVPSSGDYGGGDGDDQFVPSGFLP